MNVVKEVGEDKEDKSGEC